MMFLRATLRAYLVKSTFHAELSLPIRRFTRSRCCNVVELSRRRFASSSVDERVIVSRFNDVDVPDVGLADYVWQRVAEWPGKTAIVCGATGRSLTYAQLREKCRRFGNSLRRAGLEPGTVVGVVLPNTPDYPVAVLGAVEAGLVVTTVNPDYTPEEISKQLQDCHPRLIVTTPEKYDHVVKASQLAGGQGYKPPLIVVTDTGETNNIPQGALDMRHMINSHDEAPATSGSDIHPESPVVIPYSSGTTGLPKGVLLSHRNLVASMQIHGEPSISLLQPTTDDYQDCLPAVLPFFHVYGLVIILMYSLSLGCKVVTLPKFDPKSFLEVLTKHKASVLYLAPPLVLFLGSYPELTTEHLSSVRFVVSGSAPLGEVDAGRFLKKAPLNVKLIQGYGLTETSPVICLSRRDTTKLASVGPCVPNTRVKIMDLKTGGSLGSHQKGEVCVQGPQVMIGYHNNAEETSQAIDQSGWLHTGDIGYYDNEQDFYIVDRLKDLIKVKGYPVAPAELEELLRSHPEVSDAAVVGAPDLRTGEAVHAFLLLKPSAKASKALKKNIKSFVASKVVEYKQLTTVKFVQTIPKNASGKILRKLLREEIMKKQ